MELLRRLAVALALRAVGATASHLVMAAIYAVGWVSAYALGPHFPDDLSLLMVFEFLFLHSAGFILGFRAMPRVPNWLVIPMYLPVVVFLAVQASSWLLLVFFGWHLVSGAWSEVELGDREIGPMLVKYFPILLLFGAATMAALLLPWPELGWASVPSRLGWTFEDSGRTVRHVVPVWGTLYFTGRAAWEILFRRWERSGGPERLVIHVKTDRAEA